MARAYKLPSGNWRVQASANGQRKSFTGETRKEAELMALEWLNGKRQAQTDRTVGECIDDYIESKSAILSPTSIDSYRRHKVNDLSELLDIPLSKLTALQVQKAMNKLSMSKSAKTVRFSHGLLVAVLNVYAPEIKLNTTLPPIAKKIKQLPPIEQVIAAVVNTEIELPCLLGAWCGMRMSEIRGAKKSDIKDNVLLIHDTVVTVKGEHIRKDRTKTVESTRLIRLPPYILNLIAQLPPEQDELTTLTGNCIGKRFSKALEEHDVPHIRFHDLRHLNASTMLALNVPDLYAMERGGWSSPSVMKSVYQHTLSDKRKSVDDMIDDFFDNIVTSCTQNCSQNNK